jgi:carbon-monoxide dehydrogenase small subunit
MKRVALTVNGRRVQASVEARTHLADFLREHCRLTGTHLGCEHGVCGACTVLLDGAPARACITFAAACDGCDIQSIEGFGDDGVMAALREAFSREHALQCGFCTPGMLIAARDVVLRLPDADERRIRVEMSGNLCRCTGYLGIINAIHSVIEARRGPAEGAAPALSTGSARQAFARFTPEAAAVATDVAAAPAAPIAESVSRKGWTRLEESFVILRTPEEVWRAFADLPAVAACLPGAALLEHDGQTARGRMIVKLGPIAAAFAGSAAIEREDASMTGTIRGAGTDGGTGSRTRGEVAYRLVAEDGGASTRVFVVVEYSLQGALAQFSRSSIAQELGRRLVGEFAVNLNARLGGENIGRGAATGEASLDAGRLVWAWMMDRIRRLFGATRREGE